MTERRINEQLNQYYGSKAMSSEAIDRIRASASVANRRRTRSRWSVLSIAAAAIVGIVAGALLMHDSRRAAAPVENIAGIEARTLLVAQEMVDRHENCRNIDFEGGDLSSVLDEMADLGFAPVVPNESELEGKQLIGAHYCMVDGKRALHAVFTDPEGERLSLFEVPLPVGLDELKTPRLHELAGASVTVSARDGLLVAFAHSTT